MRAADGPMFSRWLAEVLDAPVRVLRTRPVGGGCINRATCVDTDRGRFFVKYNDAVAFPGMFRAEAEGLALLGSAEAVAVPRVAGCSGSEGLSCLVLEWIEPGPRSGDFFAAFGRSLAVLHRHTRDTFGLDRDNYIGSLPQPNTPHTGGAVFFAERRLMYPAERAWKAGRLDRAAAPMLERLCRRLPEMMPDEPPALLHGDLWNGNFMTGPEGAAVLIDPAVYYGYREADLAMSLLFGGFAPDFYDAYGEAFPLEAGWRERVDLFNLYPLLVHVNLFGGAYAGEVMAILKRLS